MKKILFFMLVVSIGNAACFKDYNERHLLETQLIEFEDAVPNSNLTGKNYPLLASLSYQSGVQKYRVNFSGRQPDKDETLYFKVVEAETTSVEGRDYVFPKGLSFVVEQGSSFGYIELEVLPTGTGSSRLVIELTGNETVKPFDNYKTIGIPIVFPSISPDPSTIEDINDIRYFKSITAGSYTNATIGTFVELKTGIVYNSAGATLQQEKIDLNYQHSSSNAANFMVPAGTPIISFGNPIAAVVGAWTTRNAGEYIKFKNTTPEELAAFDAIQSVADIEAAWVNASATVAARSGYSLTTDGPGSRIRSLAVDDIVFFHSIDKAFYAVIKVTNIVSGAAGTLTMAVKVGK